MVGAFRILSLGLYIGYGVVVYRTCATIAWSAWVFRLLVINYRLGGDSLGFGVWGLGFGGLGFGVWGLGSLTFPSPALVGKGHA
jgi:hypothetical protein